MKCDRQGLKAAAVLTMVSVLPGIVSAQTGNRPALDISSQISVDTQFNDNANNTAENAPDGEEKLGEPQYGAELNLEFEYRSANALVAGDYSYSQRKYSQDSQDNEKFLSGSTDANVYTTTRNAGLDFSHQRLLVLSDPTGLISTDNTQELEILTFEPYVASRESAFGQARLKGIFINTRYPDSPRLDSEVSGAQLSWSRSLHNTREIGLQAQQSESSFSEISDQDFESQRIGAYFRGESRIVRYSFSAGIDSITDSLENTRESAYYNLDVSYSEGPSTFNARALLQQTHSSLATGSLGGFNAISLGGSPNQLDQIEMATYELSWEYKLCGRCDLRVYASNSELDYLLLEDNDLSEDIFGSSFEYRLSSKTTLLTALDQRYSSYVNTPERDADYLFTRIVVSHRPTRKIRAGFEYRRETQLIGDSESLSNVYRAFITYEAF